MTPGLIQSMPTLPVLGQIPSMNLTDQNLRKIDLADLENKVWIADFIFTRCAGPCPLMSSHMSLLQGEFQKQPRVQLVSFTVDPEYDTPEVLLNYSERYEANPEKWLFLTGEKKDIFELSQKYFHLGASDIPEEAKKDFNQHVLHSTKFVLVDGAGRIRGYYDSTLRDQLDQLIRDVNTLIRV